MKNTFKHLIPLCPEEINKIWDNCIIVPDTNFLLQIYRYSESSRKTYLEVLNHEAIVNKLWMPFQVGLEFHENRIGVISHQTIVKDSVLDHIHSAQKTLKDKIVGLNIREHHPFLNESRLLGLIDEKIQDITSEVENLAKQHPNLVRNDALLEKIHNLFESRIGNKPSDEAIENYITEAKSLYSQGRGPGHKDDKKEENKKYSDYIIWKETIQQAKKLRMPVIFITNDTKEDWWQLYNGKKIGINFDNRKQFIEETGQDIILYTGEKFIEYASNHNKAKIDAKSLLSEMRELHNIDIQNDLFGDPEELKTKLMQILPEMKLRERAGLLSDLNNNRNYLRGLLDLKIDSEKFNQIMSTNEITDEDSFQDKFIKQLLVRYKNNLEDN
ncbi:hypothetical protein Lqui_2165 [Legionella quinlivanii]|uniref:PIN like domain-containing protein n=1 Tax=Legionella quinlivanii TaxID=45073 RepID=A0A0W0XSW4_9GAMM|nr:PIN domain-containing protein [Legionella quinlivanii]KTD47901.1 hypothetical protein Lqui_2165 [Legionella quinlivanii]SEG37070.1 hypothetical protein SAMN02746093_02692 [Legionella quinlivanii DSM 21216]STY10105.1 Uncharacterised protein [Legionella quinlivanii]